jgi:hypothetical protein
MNQFQSLRVEYYPDEDKPVYNQNVERITTERKEVICILFAEAEPGKWVHGYTVYWANGRISTLSPSLCNGYFRSKNDAKLFTLGFFLEYKEYFQPETVESIRNKIKELSQIRLF